jgi:murein L,D-transpeptidase YafK
MLAVGPRHVAVRPVATRAVVAPPSTAARNPVAIADSIVILKRAHRLTLYHLGHPIRSYRVALGGQPVGDKRTAGDRRTPEGLFFIDGMKENSEFHLALHISYPDERHRLHADSLGESAGGDIMIHGLPNGRGGIGSLHRIADWTNGCIALTDQEMDELWSVVPIGTPVEIKP